MRRESRPRTASRVAAVQALFQAEQANEALEAVIDQFVRHRFSTEAGESAYEAGLVPNAEVGLFSRIVRGASARQDVIDAEIAAILPTEWPMNRLDPVLRALLRAGGSELTGTDGPPARVVINEYLDVAHGFFAGDEPRLANGLLNRMARDWRAGEFAEGEGSSEAKIRGFAPEPPLGPAAPDPHS